MPHGGRTTGVSAQPPTISYDMDSVNLGLSDRDRRRH
jgi:hypothetical protein